MTALEDSLLARNQAKKRLEKVVNTQKALLEGDNQASPTAVRRKVAEVEKLWEAFEKCQDDYLKKLKPASDSVEEAHENDLWDEVYTLKDDVFNDAEAMLELLDAAAGTPSEEDKSLWYSRFH